MAAAPAADFGHPLRKFKLVFLGEQSGTKVTARRTRVATETR